MRSGDRAAWAALFEKYRPLLSAMVRVRVPGYARLFDGEDVLQSAFLTAWNRIGTFEYRGEGSFRQWISTVVLNRVLDKLRGARREMSRRAGDASEHLRGRAASSPSPAEAAESNDDRARLRATILELDEDDQHVLALRELEGASYAEIGAILDISAEAARRRYARAMDRLTLRLAAKERRPPGAEPGAP